jgi:ABC-2 type transport system ATP-binding protein
LGVVPQEFNFNQFEKVYDILITQAGYFGLTHQEVKADAERLLKQLDLWEKREVQARMLSGGMKRRLMIARALIHHPKVLILDEPTAGVDIEIRRSMWEFMQKLNQEGTTIILTTHYLEEAEQLCRNIAIIDQGKIIQSTSMRKLLSQLNTEVFILDLTKALPSNFSLTNFHFQTIAEDGLEVSIEKGQSLNQVFTQLSAQQVEVRSMRTKSNRLEELFVNLVHGEKA